MIDTKTAVKAMCSRYEEVYAMTLAVALIGSCDSGNFRQDAEKVIDFMGSAFAMDSSLVSVCKTYILGDMLKIGLISDYHALSAREYLSDEDLEKLALYEIKGHVIEEVIRSERGGHVHENSRSSREIKTSMKYELFHHVYEASSRFAHMRQQAAYGDVISTRQLGLLYALGIGCVVDEEKAELHLKRCMLWGDMIATALLVELYARGKKSESWEKVEALLELEKKYLQDGVALPSKIGCVSEEVVATYTVIYLIKAYLVVREKIAEIDIVFADVMLNPDISVQNKYRYISRYKEMFWKNRVISQSKKKKAGYLE